MRVLMVNRADSREAVGGDTIQMERTRNALETLGVKIDIRLTDDLHTVRWSKYDLVHIFNIQNAADAWQASLAVKRQRLPFVVSPIYWDPLPAWFQDAPKNRKMWGLVLRLMGYKATYSVYSTWQRLRYPGQLTWRCQRKTLLSASAILPNSELEKEQLVKDFRLSARSSKLMITIPNAVDRRLFEQKPKPLSSLPFEAVGGDFILQVGRVSPEKNCIGLMRALWDADRLIVFVGGTSSEFSAYAEECRHLARQRGRVEFLPWIRNEVLPRLYASAAVHVLPSWRETPGLASLEAAASGCRVVSTSMGSASEYFGSEAEYCNPDDLESIRKAVESSLQKRPSDNLRHTILERFTWDVAAQKTLGAYNLVLQSCEQ